MFCIFLLYTVHSCVIACMTDVNQLDASIDEKIYVGYFLQYFNGPYSEDNTMINLTPFFSHRLDPKRLTSSYSIV